MTENQTDRNHLIAEEEFSAGEAIRIVAETADAVRDLHLSGQLHRRITVNTISIDNATRCVALTSPTDESLSFGGNRFDQERCPPELRNTSACRISADLSQARSAFRESGFDFDPRRIDVYQLGVLLWRLLTGDPISTFLSSPQAQGRVQADVRMIVEQALGHNDGERFTNLDQFAEAINRLSTPDADAESVHSGGHPFNQSSIPSSSAADTAPSILQGMPDRNTDVPAEIAPPQRADQDLPFHKRGHYEILERIGHGGMGDVYKGYEHSLDRTVAIKVLPEEFAR
ncbi:MAG: hypothetical protein IID46_04885, partial [Planctomycetes bacterium]|nr:hypothetical protein [Planctomycetota bacterium]